jgi:hypothetical protein
MKRYTLALKMILDLQALFARNKSSPAAIVLNLRLQQMIINAEHRERKHLWKEIEDDSFLNTSVPIY